MEYITFFMNEIYPYILNGDISDKVFKVLTVDLFTVINKNFMLLWLIAKCLKVITGWTSNTFDDKLSDKFTSFLKRFRTISIKEKEKKYEKDQTITEL